MKAKLSWLSLNNSTIEITKNSSTEHLMEGSIVESKNNKKQFKLVSNGDSFALQPLAARVTDTAYVFEGEVSEAFRAGLLTLKNTDRLSIARAIGIA